MLGGDIGLIDDLEARVHKLEGLLDRAVTDLCAPGLTLESALLIREIKAELLDGVRLS